MATNGMIGRLTGGDVEHPRFEGRYHHWDSYPSGLGAALYHAYHGHFHRDATAMMHFLIKAHTHWSTIVQTDLRLEPGFIEDPSDPLRNTRPQCYCHGDRREKDGYLLTTFSDATRFGCEYVYLIDERNATMTVYHEGLGMWYSIGTIDLTGIEPRWEYLDVS